jgi:TPR repeat protein
MRIYSGLVCATVAGLVFGLAPAMSFDGASKAETFSAMSGGQAMRLAAENLKSGDKASAVPALKLAAERGQDQALWLLGRMFAKGDGVPRDDYEAFKYYRKFADSNANTNPVGALSRYVADAFVQLGRYHLSGIPDSPVTPNPELAERMFTHAASYFGDPEAQYQLARLFLEGKGQDPKRAVPWLVLAANKQHYEAQALLGRILFRGELGRSQRAAGLMWLIVAFDGPGANVPWIAELHEDAFKQASDRERAQALSLLERWVGGRPAGVYNFRDKN